jgi:competence protein ComFC
MLGHNDMNVFRLIKQLPRLIFPATSKQVAELESNTPFTLSKKLTPTLDQSSGVISLFSYRDKNTRLIIKELKYRGNRVFAELLGELLFETLLAELGEENISPSKEKFLLVPIPISKKRLRTRGYNQTELLTKHIFRCDNGLLFEHCPTLLKKIRDTKSQTAMIRKSDRLKNLIGCFKVTEKEKIRRREVVLIDDVVTTGATLREAKKTLLEAGANRVYCFTVAH